MTAESASDPRVASAHGTLPVEEQLPAYDGVHFVSSDAVRAVLSWPDALAAVREAYSQPLDLSASPPRTVAWGGGAWMRTLPALPPTSRFFGAKVMAMATTSATPGVNYVIVLFDRETSRLAAIVDGCQVTAYRTAATSAVALDHLAPDRPIDLGVIGSGLEARTHVEAFAAVRPLARVRVFSRTHANREAFAAAVGEELGVPARAVGGVSEAVDDATLVLTAARSHDERPLLFGDHLQAGMTVVSIGSTVPEQREVDSSVIERCDLIVCDHLAEVLEQTGDMLAAERIGVDVAHKSFSLDALVTGRIDDRCAAAEIALYKSVGAGIQDVAVAEVAFRKALAQGLTVPLPIEFETRP